MMFICFCFMLQQVFYITSCKCLSRRCICCNGYTRMLQVYISNILAVSEVCCKCLSGCCICCSGYTHILQTYVFKCFICFKHILQQVLHIASGFISRHKKRAQTKVVPACMRSSMACLGAQR
jgi:hypothetical protein